MDLQYGNATNDSDWSPDDPDVALSEKLVALITFVNALEMVKPVPLVSLSVGEQDLRIYPVKQSHSLFVAAARCSELSYRVLINLTNGNKAWCKLMSRNTSLLPQLVRSIMGFLQASSNAKAHKLHQKEDQATPFDRLCLALGVLTNVIQEEKSFTRQLRKTSRLNCQCMLVVN